MKSLDETERLESAHETKEVYPQKKCKRERKRDYKIGAKNPYAVASLIVKGDVPKWEEQSAQKNRADLAKIIGRGRPYSQLFDPVYGSCLFSPKTVHEIQKKLTKESRDSLGYDVAVNKSSQRGTAPCRGRSRSL